MAVALLLALVGAILLHWSDWYRFGKGWEFVILQVIAGVLFAVAFTFVCVNF